MYFMFIVFFILLRISSNNDAHNQKKTVFYASKQNLTFKIT